MEKSWTRIKMPGGRTLEVLLLGEASSASQGAPAPEPVPASPAEERALHRCPDCESDLVYPTAWQEQGKDHWSIELRCPACEWHGDGVFDQGLADSFDEALDRGTEALVHDLDRLTRANMAEEADRLAAALEADAIMPMDF